MTDSRQDDSTSTAHTHDCPTQGRPTQGDPTQGDPTQGGPTQGDPTQGGPTQDEPIRGRRSLILLPPSEGKSDGGTGEPWSPGSMRINLDSQRVRVANALRSAMRANKAERSKLLGVKDQALTRATAANRSVLDSPTTPAIERYDGVLYRALEVSTLSNAARQQVNDSVLIFSGLWGLVAPSDPIPDYKLKMGARLGPLGRLSTWWREPLSAQLAKLLTSADDTGEPGVAAVGDGKGERRTVWNLLPHEHAGALDPGLDMHQVTVMFMEPNRSGKLVAVSHWNKFLKGALVRHLVETPGTTPEDLVSWHHPSGYRLDQSRSSSHSHLTELVFVRESDPTQRAVQPPSTTSV